MIVIRRTPLVRFLASKGTLVAAMVIGMLVFIGCGLADPEAEDFLVGSGGKCICNGADLHCDAQNNQAALDVPNSEYCDATVVQSAGSCICQGSSLVCSNVGSCTFNTGGCLGLGAAKIVTVCSSSGFNSSLPGIHANGLTGGAIGTITFLNDAQCAGGAPAPTFGPPGAQPTPDGSCKCQGVDYICTGADGEVTSASYNSAQCGGSGACNCREPNKTLACPDGTYADFNPTCMGGGDPNNPCGNHVCDPGEDSTNCEVDCGKP